MDKVRCKPVYIDAAGYKSAAVPVQATAFYHKPFALRVRDGQAVKTGFRTEGAGEAINLDLASTARERTLQEAGEEILVAFLLRQCGEGKEEGQED